MVTPYPRRAVRVLGSPALGACRAEGGRDGGSEAEFGVLCPEADLVCALGAANTVPKSGVSPLLTCPLLVMFNKVLLAHGPVCLQRARVAFLVPGGRVKRLPEMLPDPQSQTDLHSGPLHHTWALLPWSKWCFVAGSWLRFVSLLKGPHFPAGQGEVLRT